MQYRPIGATGLSASVVGLGTEHLDKKPYPVVEEVIGAAIERGINILDLFMPGDEVRKNIGKALAGNREKMIIQGHIGSTDLREQYDMSRDLETCKQYFDKLLTHLGTDYIDCGMLFFLDSDEDIDAMFDNGVVAHAQDLKRQGVIRAIGASAHNPATARRVVESGVVDLIMFSINPAFDLMSGASDIAAMLGDEFAGLASSLDPARMELYRLCESRNVGITVMKAMGAGKLLSAEHSPFAQAMTPVQCIHYALTRPAVASTLVGCRNEAEVREAASYCAAGDEEKDYARAMTSVKRDFRGSCVYCNHCLPCPAEITIGTVNKYLDIAALDPAAVPPSIAQHYRELPRHGSDCIECGSCQERCPFGVPVIGNMKRAAEIFGK